MNFDLDIENYTRNELIEMFDKFVLNIFFNREYLINLNTGSKQTSYLRKMVDEIGNKFLLFTGKTPLIYQHYDNC